MSNKPKSLRILLVDDHPFVREGIRSFLSDIADLQIVAEASSALDGFQLAKKHLPDLILLDINMPGMNGVEAVGQFKKLLPGVKILILTVHNSREYVLHAAESGANGYLLKEAPPEELLQAIRAIQEGQFYYSNAVMAHVITKIQGPGLAPHHENPLTAREREVLVHSAQGLSVKEIAELLHLTPTTVQTYRVRIMEKLDIHNIAGLVKYALQKRLIE